MPTILLINPNTSAATTRMMLGAAELFLPPDFTLRGCQAEGGVPMITNDHELAVGAEEVVRIGCREAPHADGIIVAAFGDPGVSALRDRISIPVVGIGQASLLEAGAGGRRFGVATTTPALVLSIEAAVRDLTLTPHFSGVRVSPVDPVALAASPADQDEALANAVLACMQRDRADAVVIGGGPLSASAARLKVRFGSAIVEPLPAAIRLMAALLADVGKMAAKQI